MQRHFDTKLWKERIQPVWIEVSNATDRPFWLPRVAIDHDYYPTLEASYRSHRFAAPRTNARIDEYFQHNELSLIHPPGSTSSGFVFAEYLRDVKAFNVELLGGDTLQIFHFSQEVPGFASDFNQREPERFNREEEVKTVRTEELRKELEELPG